MQNTAALLSLNAKRLKLIAISLLFLVFGFLFLVFSPALAAPEDCNPPENPTSEEVLDQVNRCAIEKNIFDDKVFNLNQLSGTGDSLYTLLLGESQLHPEITQVTKRQGALASAGRLVAMLYNNPPASGISYTAQQIQKLNPVQPAYAQGVGFSALEPVQGIWENFRNASYIGFVIVFVIVGFMIMFRAHISPQAVASVQDSLPRIVIALILVTFSYAIAGFMIDIMFLAINFMATIIPVDAAGANKVFTHSVVGVMADIWKDVVTKGAGAFGELLQSVLSDIPDWINGILKFFGTLIAGLVIAIAAFYVTFRIFFMLLVSYVTVVVLTIFAPFFFLVQALPGQNGGREWFKQMAANLSVFATIAIMFLIAAYMGGITQLGGAENSAVVGDSSLKFPLFVGNLDIGAIGKLIGFGFIFFSPEAAKMVKDWITTGKAQAPGGAGALAGGLAGIGAGAGMAGKFAQQHNPVSDYMRTRQARTQAVNEAKGRRYIEDKKPDLLPRR